MYILILLQPSSLYDYKVTFHLFYIIAKMILSLIIKIVVFDFFKKIIVIYFFNLDHHVPAHCVCIGQKRSPRTGVRDGCDQTCECRELNPDLLQAQHVILTTGLSLQPNCYFERKL